MKNLSKLRSFFNLTQEDLAEILSVETNTIALYESEKATPSFKILKKMISYYDVSWDFFLLDEDCIYPKNIKLLRLAKKLDELTKAEARNSIEYNAKSFLGEKINEKLKIKFDDNSIILTDNFNSNLKQLRILNNLKQIELATSIEVSRSLLSKYEENTYPPIDKIIKLSEIFNISIHALTTGEKLSSYFKDGYFGEIMLLADYFLPFEQQKILITLMEAILQNTSYS